MKAAHKIFVLFYALFLRLWHRKPVIVLERRVGLGDVICCIPAYHELKKLNPDSLVVFVTAAPYVQMLRASPGIDAVYGMPEYIGIPPRKAAWLGCSVYLPQTSEERETSSQTLHLTHAFLQSCGLPIFDSQPRIFISPENKKVAAERFGFEPGEALIAIHSGRTWPVRELPEDRWRDIVEGLKQSFPGRLLHFSFASREAGQSPYCFQDVQTLPDNLDVMTIAAILSQCRLLVGIDSGLLHLAGAVGTPTVGLFGPVNPRFRLPLGTPTTGVFTQLPCSFCHHERPIKHWRISCPHNIRCMREISPGQVIEAAEKLLAKQFDKR